MSYRRGEVYGLRATPARFQVRSLRPKTPNLYLTGQDVVTLGVAGAMLGGLATASYLLRRSLAADLSKPVAKRKGAGRPLPHETGEPQSAVV